LRSGFSSHRNCRTSIASSQALENFRQQKLEKEKLEKDWRELLTHATIVKHPERILSLNANPDQQRKRETAGKPRRD
jgi:hypothetical protein